MRIFGRMFAVIGIVLGCLLSSCSSRGPATETQPASTATPVLMTSPQPSTMPTMTPAATHGAGVPSSPTPAGATPIQVPTAAGPTATPEPRDCIDRMTFDTDVTVPDNTLFAPGEPFTKTWRIYNSGTCTWDSSYHLAFADGDPLNGPLEGPIPAAVPGQAVEVSVPLMAPYQGGGYASYWKLRDYAGQEFGAGVPPNLPLWVIINVTFFQAENSAPFNGVAEAAIQAQVLPMGDNTTLVSLVGGAPGKANGTSAGNDLSGDDALPNEGAENPQQVNADVRCNVLLDSSIPDQVIALVNTAREQNGVSTLSESEALATAAQLHSLDMACNQNTSHTGSDGSRWSERVSAQGYSRPTTARENIYSGDPAFGATPQGVFDWWMGSQVHHDNILWPDVADIGVGYAYYNGSAYYTLLVATP